jgi:predicted amidophosphoribosyltransferase
MGRWGVTDDRHCPVCGQVLPPAGSCPNRWCRRADRGFSVVFALGVYRGPLRRAIARYKYRGERTLAAVFAGMVSSFVGAHPGWFEEFDVITAVPGYTGAGSRRGWDPLACVLAELSGRLGPAWAVEPGLVLKTRETPGMTGLGWAERQNVAHRYLRPALRAAPGAALTGSRVLVLDDVLTEGSTLREVALALRRAGASDVAGLVLARRPWSSEPPRPEGM